MATVELTKDNFEQLITDDNTVLIDFWAPWCGPCKMFGPVFEAASEQHADLVFGKVNTEEQQELAAEFGIMSIPTLMVIRERVMIFNQPGALPGPALEEIIGKVKALDMAEVRRQIEEHDCCGHDHEHDCCGHHHEHEHDHPHAHAHHQHKH